MKVKKLPKRKVVQLLVAIVVVGAGTALYFGIAQAQKSDEPKPTLREYSVNKGDLTSGISTKGNLRYEGVPQNFSESVILGKVFVKQGQVVKAGDKIAEADEKKLEESVEDARAALEKANLSLNQATNAKTLGELNRQKENLEKAVGNSDLNAQIAEKNSDASSLREKIARLEDQINQSTISMQDKAELEKELEQTHSELGAIEASLASLNTSQAEQNTNAEKQKNLDQSIANNDSANLSNAIKQAQVDVDVAQRKLDKLEAVKKDPYIYASTEGAILSLEGKQGSETSPDSPIAIIGKQDERCVQVPISQSDIGKVKNGQEVEIMFDALGDKKFKGVVKERMLTPIKDSNPLSYQVIITLEDSQNTELLEGMTLNALLIIKQQKNVLQVSNKAIELTEGKQYVNLKNSDGSYNKIEIETGFSDGKASEIISGLKQGDIVVVEG